MKKIRIKKEAKMFLASFLATVAVIFLLIVVTALYYKNTKTLPPIINSLIEKVTNTETSGLENNLPMNILVLGGDEKEGGRSDTIMLVRIQKDFQPIIISIPRDTRVKIEGIKGYSKINAAYAFGKSKLAIKTVEDLLGIKIDRYVALNYEAVKKIVDAVGGVDVEVPFHLYYKDTTPGKELFIDIPAGLQHLDGEKAVEFLRWRHNSNGKEYGRGGDLGRIEMQKKFVFALIEKVLKPQNLIKLPSIIQTATKYVDHNFTRNEMVWFVQNAGKFSSQNIMTAVLPGYPKYIDKVSYYILDEGKCKQLVKDLNEPEIIKEDIRIKVIGETGSEKAALLKSELESKGYINVGLESQKSIQNSTIELKRINRKYLEQLKNDIDLSTFQVVYSPDYEEKYDIYIKIK
ncbi:LytR family transcriptional attenuator [Caldicellulosiruptor bescii]|uniref:Cell envelope-related transcriptional attenuator n=2 Tax=Caldicellulosiruptor bescii TaxID=31899 RepID=B9MRP8_CALBD|nr:LCP family protein [Caldicellulosiruptor bescii]ACM60352.1 cell envelope-related transcriptional attenuator [Caldicellulosiruptor bescii DSM 6725]PBC87766.1 LytR family transcriptional attenuator [Caldicellulosiruptor bescii]PBC90698.1 LytR family transcriptional attenuator [Caldicellulosiruptor bescii]PBD03869.1 LytR family transcriptional attenuator [Caldicellulosiruptor bescii]PBD06496.1 LytR family transcriptional attenuator [Caldicellulosiruptor bescii]